ncbi:uncharacterized protein [Dermacentor albipictus]|uniref:uncharacterized protein isoform X1 n=1 Tax=Dermacentor albipictus TaxID=60249 RepID=UPI0038FD29A0
MMNPEQKEAVLLGLLASTFLSMHDAQKHSPKRQRQWRWWLCPALQEHEQFGHATKLLPLLRDRNMQYYREYLRMPPRTFDMLVQLVGPHVQKKDTNFRKAISPEHQVAQTVRFLAAGERLRSPCFSFLSGRSTACGIVSSVCQVLWDVLGPLGNPLYKPPCCSKSFSRLQVFSYVVLPCEVLCYKGQELVEEQRRHAEKLVQKFMVTLTHPLHL